MAKKYPGVSPDNTQWDEFNRSQGQMTNNEFFSSNGKGGFYEGMEWDEENEEWVLNAEEQRKRDEEKYSYTCRGCEQHKSFCECPPERSSDEDDG
jgi:hypothetical protein